MNKGEKTKNRIIDVARELFSEKGYTAVTMTAIKESVGMSIGAVYKYFPSIKDIYLAILARDEVTAKDHTHNTDSMTGEQILAYALERNYELAMEVSGCDDEELRQRAILLFNYMNGFQLTATNYLFTKEDMVHQLKLLRKLLFEICHYCRDPSIAAVVYFIKSRSISSNWIVTSCNKTKMLY